MVIVVVVLDQVDLKEGIKEEEKVVGGEKNINTIYMRSKEVFRSHFSLLISHYYSNIIRVLTI